MGNAVSGVNNPLNSLKDSLQEILSNAHIQILLIGIESSGKSTLLQRLKYNHYVDMTPTVGFDSCKFKYVLKNKKVINIQLWDLGGQDRVRPLWRSFIKCADAIFFVIDGSDITKLEEAKMEFKSAFSYFGDCKRNYRINAINKHNTKTSAHLGTFTNSNNPKPPFILLANKCDLPSYLFTSEKGINILNDYFYQNISFSKIEELKYMLSTKSTSKIRYNCEKILYDVNKYKQINNKPNEKKYNKKSISASQFSLAFTNITPKALRVRREDNSYDKKDLKVFGRQFCSTSNLNSPSIQADPFLPHTNFQNSAFDGNSFDVKQKDGGLKDLSVYPVCAVTGEGLDDALVNLLDLVVANKRRRQK